MNTTEFDEIRPYHDEELPRIFEELIADPAFQKAACTVILSIIRHYRIKRRRMCI